MNGFLDINKNILDINKVIEKTSSTYRNTLNIGKNLQESLNIGKNLQESLNIGKNLQKSLNIGKNLQESLNIGKNLQKSLNIGTSFKSCKFDIPYVVPQKHHIETKKIEKVYMNKKQDKFNQTTSLINFITTVFILINNLSDSIKKIIEWISK